MPHPPGSFSLSGVWESKDSATFVTWYQDISRWDNQPVIFSMGAKVLFKAMPLEHTPDRNLKLAPPASGDASDFDGPVALLDCNNVLMYALRVHKRQSHHYEVYNSMGEFLAIGDTVEHLANHVHFQDEVGQPIAFAQSPAILGEMVADDPWFSASSGAPARRQEGEPGALQPWEIWFLPEHESNSSLALAQHRWVLAAAIQDRALKDALRTRQYPSGFTRALILIIPFIFLIAALLGLVNMSSSILFRLVYPQYDRDSGNPFMKCSSGRAGLVSYGGAAHSATSYAG